MTDYALIKRFAATLDVSTPAKIERAARALLDMAGLYDWTFVWSRARRGLGCCSYSKQQIRLSKYLVARLKPEVKQTATLDTLLHEIAHALCPHSGHGPHWRQVARAIGSNGRRCAVGKVDTDKIKYNWLIECANVKCDNSWHQHRLDRKKKAAMEKGEGYRCAFCKNPKFLIYDLRSG